MVSPSLRLLVLYWDASRPNYGSETVYPVTVQTRVA